MHAPTLKSQLEVCTWIVSRNLEGFDHEKSMMVLPGSEMSLNWVLGHIVSARNSALALFGAAPLYGKQDFAPYGQREAPLTDDEAIAFDELVRRYDNLRRPWMEGLDRLTAADFAKPVPFSPRDNPDETVGSLLAVLVYHEAYHTGQMGPLRRNAGLPNVLRNPSARK